MINKVELIGRLGANPEMKDISNGKLAKLSVGTTEVWNNKNGEKQEETSWHNVTFFGKNAENVEKLLQKGSLVYVEGKIKYSTVEQADGTKKRYTDINAFSFKLLKDGKARAEATTPTGTGTNAQPQAQPEMSGGGAGADDDLPF